MNSVTYKEKWIIYDNGTVYSIKKNKFLTGMIDKNNGYVYIHLDKRHRLHKLVALSFLPNPHNYDVIDHIDRDKTNNNVSNLRWASQSINRRNSKDNVKILNLDTKESYNSKVECAERLNTSPENVYQCLKHNCRCRGYRLKRI